MSFRTLSAYDKGKDALTDIALADWAGNIRGYEVLGSPDDDPDEKGSGN